MRSKIQDDPIELLEKIKVLMHDPIRAKYPFASLTEAIMRMLNIKQFENEGLLDYVKRFKQSRDIMKSHVGTDILDKFVENTREYRDEIDTSQKEKLKEGAFEKWMAYLLIRNSDQSKYGTLMNGLVSQFSMENNQYPKTIMGATDILSSHKFDKRGGQGNQGNRNKDRKGNWQDAKKEDDDETKSTLKTDETSFSQSDKSQKCYCCGKKGHLSPECPDKNNIEKKDWYIRKAEQYMQSEQGDKQEHDDNASTTSGRSSRIDWSGLLIATTVDQTIEKESHHMDDQDLGKRLRNSITLDNGSTLSLFSNPDLVENIRRSDKTLVLATNAGVKQSNQEASVPGFGKVYFDKDAIANIFGLSDLKKKYRITYDSMKEDAFLVYKENEIIRFECSPEGLYQYEVSKGYKSDLKDSGTSYLVSTVTENRKGYTLRQFERAKQARKLYHIVGTPTIENFKSLIRMNIIKNCPVTVEDINIAEKIFGPDISSLKGKSTRRKPKPARKDLIKIPKELIMKHHDIELCMDTMYINQCGMLTAIDRTVKYRSLVPIDTRHHEEYYRALDQILRYYNNAGFVITEIHCDGEYRGMMNKVKDDLDVKMNFTNTQDHVPEAERNNRTIKERIRAAFQRLPYKAITKVMIRHLAMTQANQLNLFPVKGGVSTYYSPRMILNQTNLDYTKHCTVPFGAYVQANHETSKTNSQVTRTLDAIYLRPAQNQQGGHELMDLNSGQCITRNIVHEIPVTEVVIKAVETMAYKQGFTDLKFKNRHGVIFHDADWIAGVDYDDNDDDNENDDEEYHPEYEDEEELEQEEHIDPDEVDEITADARENANPNINEEQVQEVQPEQEQPEALQDQEDDANIVSDGDEEESQGTSESTRRSIRTTQPIERLSYMQATKVTFKNEPDKQLEYCHNLIAQTKPRKKKEYEPSEAMLMARLINEMNTKIIEKGISFAQQYLLNKGIKVFGQKRS